MTVTIVACLVLLLGTASAQVGDPTAGLTPGPSATPSQPGSASDATVPAGVVWAWGYNFDGQLGDGTTTDRWTPVAVSGLTDVVAIAGFHSHSLALRSNGTVWAWGDNSHGQLGDGTTTDRLTPVAVSGLTDVVAIAAGGSHSLALRSDGTVWSWGWNAYGQLGDGTNLNRSTPVPVAGLANVVDVSADNVHSLALRSDGTVWAWGNNWYGQVGDGTQTHRWTPAAVSGLANVVAIAGGAYHSLALRSNGTVWAWGSNYYGQLGDGTTTDRLTPVAVGGLTEIVAIDGGYAHSLALRGDGTVWSWGWNAYGQLGDGTFTDRLTPVAVSGLTDVVTVAGGGGHSLALRSDGTVWAWGDNSHGQLGDGTTTHRWTPVAVSGLANVVAIAGGDEHSLAVLVPPTLDPIPGPLQVGGTTTLTGTGFTAGTVIKLYVATATGAVAYGPYPPEAWSSTTLTWDIPATVPLGNGFGSVQVVNTDQGYAASNIVGALLEGDPLDHIPTLLYLNGEGLAPADPSIGVAHIDTVLAKGSTVTLTGTGFASPGVNLFTATGNVGPLWPVAGWTATQFQVTVPVTTPTGPGNVQVVNSPYTGNVQSNAVSAVIGARPTITGVTVNGATVTVTGTGFCSLSVINLFNQQGATVVNLGGLTGTTPKVPLTLVNDTQFTFTVPAGAVAGPAFVEVLNPPYIPFASSGNDPDGAFTIP